MAKKIDIEKKAPAHYAEVNAIQERMKSKCSTEVKVKIGCPYCGHPVITAFKGQHDSFMAICPSCEKEVFFPPIKFRRVKCG